MEHITEIPVERHPLKPFLPENGEVLMLGSFPPQLRRWSMHFFYPNFTNDMWRVMGIVFFSDPVHFVDVEHKTYKKELIEVFLLEKGIAMFDTASAVRRLADNTSDKDLEIVEPTIIELLLSELPQCRTIVTTGQKATDTFCERYSIRQPRIGEWKDVEINGKIFRLYRMPSTSRAYPLAIGKKAELYRGMFKEVGLL